MAYPSWSTAELRVVTDGYKAGKSPEDISDELKTRTPGAVINQARMMCLTDRVLTPVREAEYNRACAINDDLNFKRAMLKARAEKTEKVRIGVVTESSTESPKSHNATLSPCIRSSADF